MHIASQICTKMALVNCFYEHCDNEQSSDLTLCEYDSAGRSQNSRRAAIPCIERLLFARKWLSSTVSPVAAIVRRLLA